MTFVEYTHNGAVTLKCFHPVERDILNHQYLMPGDLVGFEDDDFAGAMSSYGIVIFYDLDKVCIAWSR